jgi:hypothetical protein
LSLQSLLLFWFLKLLSDKRRLTLLERRCSAANIESGGSASAAALVMKSVSGWSLREAVPTLTARAKTWFGLLLCECVLGASDWLTQARSATLCTAAPRALASSDAWSAIDTARHTALLTQLRRLQPLLSISNGAD